MFFLSLAHRNSFLKLRSSLSGSFSPAIIFVPHVNWLTNPTKLCAYGSPGKLCYSHFGGEVNLVSFWYQLKSHEFDLTLAKLPLLLSLHHSRNCLICWTCCWLWQHQHYWVLELLQQQGITAPITEATQWCTVIVVTFSKSTGRIKMYIGLPKLNLLICLEVAVPVSSAQRGSSQ